MLKKSKRVTPGISVYSRKSIMLLSQFQKGQEGVIRSTSANGVLKSRLLSFGLTKGVGVKVLEHSPDKSTIKIKTHNGTFGLRFDEAATFTMEASE